MKIELISVGPFAVNCAVVWGDAKQALVIDPGYDAELIQSFIEDNELTVAATLLTHGHADHISALAELHATRPAPIYLHEEDERWAFGENNQIPPHYPVPTKPATKFLRPESSKDCHSTSFRCRRTASASLPAVEWKIADLDFQCLETPGHTPGGVCYWFKEENVCFTGDTLFKGSCGRTDLPGGDSRILTTSLKKLATLPPETRIIAGHGEETTVEYELKTNFFLQSH